MRPLKQNKMKEYNKYIKQTESFKISFEEFVKKTLGKNFFSIVEPVSQGGYLYISITIFRGVRSSNSKDVEPSYYLNLPHYFWFIGIGSVKNGHLYKSEMYSTCYGKRKAKLNPRCVYATSTKKADSEGELTFLFRQIEKWISSNKRNLFED